MDGKLFLTTARFLQSRGSGEAAYRSAVSRAYYACFLEVRQVVFDNCDELVRWRANINNVSRLLHTPLQWYLKSSSVRNIQKLGEDLASLHGNRKDADYNMGRSLTADDSQGAIDDAQALLDAFSCVAPEMIGNAMSEYIQRNYE